MKLRVLNRQSDSLFYTSPERERDTIRLGLEDEERTSFSESFWLQGLKATAQRPS
eukprot:m.47627 g.47627  ORF g.47627 m.47627 type:complete len:55 (+) comp12336_c0_seq1:604-768(+)